MEATRFLTCLIIIITIISALGEHHRSGHDDRHSHPNHDSKQHGQNQEEEDEQTSHEEEYDQLEKRLDDLVSRLHSLDEKLDERLDPENKEKALSFENRVSLLEESHCDEDHWDCGGDDTECISRLKVCDGTKDCRNGDDEENCDLPVNVGDIFVGHTVFDHCTQRRPDEITIEITAVRTESAYPALPTILANLHIAVEDEEAEHEVVLPTNGYYRFNKHNLVLLPPEDDRLLLICDFDGHNEDKCIGNIVHEATLETCARFIFFRKSGDEEEGHEEDEEEEEEE